MAKEHMTCLHRGENGWSMIIINVGRGKAYEELPPNGQGLAASRPSSRAFQVDSKRQNSPDLGVKRSATTRCSAATPHFGNIFPAQFYAGTAVL
jgi:hypothetical protein